MQPLLKRAAFFLAGAVLVPALLFTLNGLSPAWRTPDSGTLAHPALEAAPAELRVVAYNIAKAGYHRGGARFASRATVEQRLDAIAAAVRDVDPHLVFLSEVARGDGPSPVDQVSYLAEALAMHAWAFSANYSFGVPFYRLRSGNAVLSKLPLTPLAVQQLAGARPFYQPTNNRRLLWCEVALAGERLRIGSVRNDSFDLTNNALQTREILATLDGVPALLAGDFNAEPQDESMRLLRQSGAFTAAWEGPATFPAGAPKRRIDFILAPASWTLLEHRVLPAIASDHLAVYSRFARPR